MYIGMTANTSQSLFNENYFFFMTVLSQTKLGAANVSIIQRSQSKILRNIVNAPWNVSNATLHTDLGIQYVQDVIQKKCNKHLTALEVHNNPLLKTLLARKEH
jgi:hypothetical protein